MERSVALAKEMHEHMEKFQDILRELVSRLPRSSLDLSTQFNISVDGRVNTAFINLIAATKHFQLRNNLIHPILRIEANNSEESLFAAGSKRYMQMVECVYKTVVNAAELGYGITHICELLKYNIIPGLKPRNAIAGMLELLMNEGRVAKQLVEGSSGDKYILPKYSDRFRPYRDQKPREPRTVKKIILPECSFDPFTSDLDEHPGYIYAVNTGTSFKGVTMYKLGLTHANLTSADKIQYLKSRYGTVYPRETMEIVRLYAVNNCRLAERLLFETLAEFRIGSQELFSNIDINTLDSAFEKVRTD